MYINGKTAGSFLYNQNISYYAYGTLKQNKKIIGYFFKTDKLTHEQKENLKCLVNNVDFLGTAPQYAPELKRTMIVFKTKAQMKSEVNQ